LPWLAKRDSLRVICWFVRSGRIQAQSFDLRSFKLSGDLKPSAKPGTFSVSTNGVLAYHESSAESS